MRLTIKTNKNISLIEMNKGVSPLLAVSALIFLTLIASAALFGITKESVNQQIQDSKLKEKQSRGCFDISLQADSADFDVAEGKITTTLRNTGGVDLTDFRLIVYYDSNPLLPQIRTPENSKEVLVPGDITVIENWKIEEKPDRMVVEALWKSGQCPDIQPLDECRFVGNSFVC